MGEQYEKYLLAVLASVLHEEETPPLSEKLNWKSVFELAVFHGVESMVFSGIKEQLDHNSPIFKEWEKRDLRNILLAVSQQEAIKEVIVRLTAAGIKVLPMKGSVLQELYGQIHFRYMGDLDILIEKDRALEAKHVMEEAGYQTAEFGGLYHDTYLRHPYICVELHRSMLPADNAYYGYFENIWERALTDEKIPGCFRLTWEDFYLFHIIHFKKHYRHSGSGIRAILDTYQFRKQYGDVLDEDKLNGLLRRLKLEDICHFMELLSVRWFGTEKEKEKIMELDLTGMEEKIWGSGLYGDRFIEASGEYWTIVENGKTFPKIRYFFSRLFPAGRKIESDYHMLSRYPMLLPFCWIHRWFIAVFRKRKLLTRELYLLTRRKNKKPEV